MAIRHHLRRLNADGGNGIAVDLVVGFPERVALYDTQREVVSTAAEVLTCLRALPDIAGFADTWQALSSLPEYGRSD